MTQTKPYDRTIFGKDLTPPIQWDLPRVILACLIVGAALAFCQACMMFVNLGYYLIVGN